MNKKRLSLIPTTFLYYYYPIYKAAANVFCLVLACVYAIGLLTSLVQTPCGRGVQGSHTFADKNFQGPDYKKILRFLLRLSQVRSQVYRKFSTYDIV